MESTLYEALGSVKCNFTITSVALSTPLTFLISCVHGGVHPVAFQPFRCSWNDGPRWRLALRLCRNRTRVRAPNFGGRRVNLRRRGYLWAHCRRMKLCQQSDRRERTDGVFSNP